MNLGALDLDRTVILGRSASPEENVLLAPVGFLQHSLKAQACVCFEVFFYDALYECYCCHACMHKQSQLTFNHKMASQKPNLLYTYPAGD